MTKLAWEVTKPQPYNEAHFLDDLGLVGPGCGGHQPVLANALARHGLGLAQLRLLRPTNGRSYSPSRHPAFTTQWKGRPGPENTLRWDGWPDLLEIRNLGPRRLLALVNYLRGNGVELPWFTDFDEWSYQWRALEGCYRFRYWEPPG